MQYIIRKYFSGYCTYEVEADTEEKALKLIQRFPVDYDEICSTLEEWKECNEIESAEDS